MYKHLITVPLFAILLLLVSCPAKAQIFKNPDGENLSIHITPYLTDANIKIFKAEGSVNQTLNYNIMFKIPLSAYVTTSLFYKSEDYDLGFVGIKKKNYGVTLSIYIE